MHKRSIVRDKKSLTLRKYSHISAIMLTAVAFLSSGKEAAAFTADDVLNKMNVDQRISYIDGIVDGLATARWLSDKPNADGMNCILGWYFQRPNTEVWNQIISWFESHTEQQAGVLMAVLTKRQCGE